MKNQIIGSTIVFAPHSLEEAINGLAQAGYTHCEIGAVKGWFEHIDPDETSDEDVIEIRGVLQSAGVTPVSMSGHTQLQTQEGMERFSRAIEIAAALGMSIINTFTGDAETEEERTVWFRNIDKLCDRAKAAGLLVGLETDSNMLPTAKIGVEILAQIDRPGDIGFNYDPGNVVYYTGADPVSDIDYALPQMVHFHFKDKVGGKGVFNFPPPGDGELPMTTLLEKCESAGYLGPISAEVEFNEHGWPNLAGCQAAADRSVANLKAMGLTW